MCSSYKNPRLEDGCCTTQAEIYAIGEAARLIRENDRPNRKVTIYSDSQAALRCIASKMVRSKVVMSCQEALSWICEGKVGLRWVLGHSNVKGNIEADRLAKLGVGMEGTEAID